MKSIVKSVAFVSLSWIFLYISCKKEYSCENCGSNPPAGSTNKFPIAVAGPDQVITLPTDSILLDGSASSDPDGIISSFLWTKISGPASFIVNNASIARTSVRNLIVGIYQIELKVTDDKGLSAKDTVQITVNDPSQPNNRPPVANAGPDQTITLPSNTIALNGSASTDPDNNIISYAWTKITGPSSFNILNANAVQTQVTNLVQGVYQVELKVTDAGGLFSKDTMQLTVNDQLPPPPPLNCDTANRPTGNANLTFLSQLPEPRYGITVAAAGNKIFIAGGFASYSGINPANFSNRVDIYDITTGQWTNTQLSEPCVIDAVAVLGNKIFFAGGYNSNSFRTTVDIYDLSTNTWSTAQLSQARWGIAGGEIDNKVFFAGGTINIPIGGGYYTQQLLSTVDIYDATTNSWSTASLSEGRYCLYELEKINVTVVGHRIFFNGGSCNTTQDCSSNRIDMYDAATNTWSNENYIPHPPGWALFAGIAAGNKNFRVTGDYWEGGNLVEIRDEIIHTTSYECLSGTLYNAPVKKDNKLIFPVSTSPQSTSDYKLTHFDVYDLATNTWSIYKLPPPGVNHRVSFISVNNEVYAMDGYYQNNGFLYDKVYKLGF